MLQKTPLEVESRFHLEESEEAERMPVAERTAVRWSYPLDEIGGTCDRRVQVDQLCHSLHPLDQFASPFLELADFEALPCLVVDLAMVSHGDC